MSVRYLESSKAARINWTLSVKVLGVSRMSGSWLASVGNLWRVPSTWSWYWVTSQ